MGEAGKAGDGDGDGDEDGHGDGHGRGHGDSHGNVRMEAGGKKRWYVGLQG